MHLKDISNVFIRFNDSENYEFHTTNNYFVCHPHPALIDRVAKDEVNWYGDCHDSLQHS